MFRVLGSVFLSLGNNSLIFLEPVGYHEMLRFTLRWNTERPVTLREFGGASVLVGNNIDRIREEYHIAVLQEKRPVRPELWDGKTAERCLEAILKFRCER